jgi:hypothetical protein
VLLRVGLCQQPARRRTAARMVAGRQWTRIECGLLLLGGLGCLQLLFELVLASSGLPEPTGSVGTPTDTAHHHQHGGTDEAMREMAHGGHGEQHSEQHSKLHSERHSEPHIELHSEQGSFCSGMPMVMGNMQGFSREACVVLFFARWQLTSSARMWLAVLGVLLLSVSYEWLKAVERGMYELPTAAGSTAAATGGIDEARVVRALTHGLVIAVAYLCMFVAMTFNPLLFLTQVFGFVLGHWRFGPSPGLHGAAALLSTAGGDPCCD